MAIAKAAMIVIIVVLALLSCGSIPGIARSRQNSSSLPTEISDAEFWRMIEDFSEPGGTYPYENFVSNEQKAQQIFPALTMTTKRGGVFLGVGPEQNFTYVSALHSQMAFIIDIRRQNMLELLLYKALFELSPTRAEFVGRLFSRPIPGGLSENESVASLFAAIDKVEANANFHAQNLQSIKSAFAKHGYKLTDDDLLRIDYIYQVFYRGGPSINYSFMSPSPIQNPASYATIMNSPDSTGHNWAFLANEENYRYVRELQRKNMIVPLVGDFAGPRVIRNIGRYLKEHGSVVSAFYVSNVESYFDAQKTQIFYSNVSTLPVDASSMFIRFVDGDHTPSLPWWKSGMGNLNVISPMIDVTSQVLAGRQVRYDDTLKATKDPLAMAGLSRTSELGVGPIVFVPKGAPAPAGYTMIGTTKQTIQLLNGSQSAVDLDVYTRK